MLCLEWQTSNFFSGLFVCHHFKLILLFEVSNSFLLFSWNDDGFIMLEDCCFGYIQLVGIVSFQVRNHIGICSSWFYDDFLFSFSDILKRFELSQVSLEEHHWFLLFRLVASDSWLWQVWVFSRHCDGSIQTLSFFLLSDLDRNYYWFWFWWVASRPVCVFSRHWFMVVRFKLFLSSSSNSNDDHCSDWDCIDNYC
jgi:hypothetical protein